MDTNGRRSRRGADGTKSFPHRRSRVGSDFVCLGCFMILHLGSSSACGACLTGLSVHTRCASGNPRSIGARRIQSRKPNQSPLNTRNPRKMNEESAVAPKPSVPRALLSRPFACLADLTSEFGSVLRLSRRRFVFIFIPSRRPRRIFQKSGEMFLTTDDTDGHGCGSSAELALRRGCR